jgi:hypothetical protein
MKRTLLLVSLLTFAVPVAFAQMSTMPNPKDAEADRKKTSFQKFHERLRIGLFSIFTSPTLYDIERGNYEYGAIAPASQIFPGNRDGVATSFWNQVSFNYNFGAKMNFVFNPRFSFYPVRAKQAVPENRNPDQTTVQVEDFLVGFQGVVLASDDKKFNLWIRPGVRLPTSRASRNSTNGGFGSTSYQYELAYLPTYDFNKTWQVGIFGQLRQWIFDDRYSYARFRFYTAPFVQYTINDTSRFQLYFESMVENTRRWETLEKKKKPKFRDIYQNVFFGVNHDVTKSLNVFPFVGFFPDDPAGLTNKSVWLGAWISYQIK